MSRVGGYPVAVPDEVTVTLDDAGSDGRARITVEGPLGELTRDLPEHVSVSRGDDGDVVVARVDDSRAARSQHGLARSLIANMVTGVTVGYTKELELNGVGYRAEKKGASLELQVGFSHPIDVEPAEDIEFDVPQPNRIIVRGIDKVAVGQTAANIRAVREPEPYKGKGIRYVGERVRRKAGKAAAR